MMILFKMLAKKFVKDGASQFQTLCEFPQISHTVLYEIISVRLGYHKFCTRWVPKMLTGMHKMQRMALALTFLEQYHKDGNEFLSHIVWVTGDEIWVSFVNVETKEQSKQWMRTHPPNKPKMLKQTLSARKLMATVFWGFCLIKVYYDSHRTWKYFHLRQNSV
jgi:hypothetical protein